jgi:hypothetical protein
MCIVGGSRDVSPVKGAFGVVATALGIAAFVLIVLGLITGSESVLLALAGVIGFLWFITTLRHAIVPATAAHQRGDPATFESCVRRNRCEASTMARTDIVGSSDSSRAPGGRRP